MAGWMGGLYGEGEGEAARWVAGWWGCHLLIMERKEDRRWRAWQL